MMKNKKNYIGIACTGHDNAIAIVNSCGDVVFAEGAERSTKNKRAINLVADDFSRVSTLIDQYCEENADIVVAKTWSDQTDSRFAQEAELLNQQIEILDEEKDNAWINRVLMHTHAPQLLVKPNSIIAGVSTNIACSLRQRQCEVRSYNHHLTHAAYGCYTSPFEEAVCAVIDGIGEAESASYYHYTKGQLKPFAYPESEKNKYASLASLGIYYGETLCALFGFSIFTGDEWKVMGLAPYGKLNEAMYEVLKKHIYVDGLSLVVDNNGSSSFNELQQFAKRQDQSFEDVADIAYTGQYYFCELMTAILNALHANGLSDNLVLTGGCALNSSYNGFITEKSNFKHLYVPSAPADDGNAIGAALLAYAEDQGNIYNKPPRFQTPYLGSDIEQSALRALTDNGAIMGLVDLAETDLCDYIAKELTQGKIVAWMQGRAEFGPRALGNRSILADPRRDSMKDRINAIIKFREAFRPFAPAILDQHGDEYFENYSATPYMEKTLRFKEAVRDKIPAVCHADYTGRLQSVKPEWNERFYTLIQAFYRLTDIPILLNTSLNVMGKPIVHDVGDAITIYLTSGIDILVIDNAVFSKQHCLKNNEGDKHSAMEAELAI